MIRPLVFGDYDKMIEIIRVGPRSRYKIRNTVLISHPNKAKWDGFFRGLGHRSGGWVREVEGKIVGLALGVLSENFWDDQKIGKVILWYVDPEYKGVTAIRLFQRLHSWFTSKEVDYILVSCDFESDASKVYRKMGFKPLEETLYYLEEAK